ncbi:hypothetical protein HYW99_01510 [Candidatus Woesearchaeota archaeon]|nr:hypothetical protein [Candidatus Woesearchaeota archaeon]
MKNKTKLFVFLFLLSISIFLISCTNQKSRVISQAELIANNWDDNKFMEIYSEPNNFGKINDFRENAFGILRTVCEGKIYFKTIEEKAISDDKIELIINMYCDGAVDFKKLGAGYENYIKKEANKDNLIDDAKIILVDKNGKWLIDDFNY